MKKIYAFYSNLPKKALIFDNKLWNKDMRPSFSEQFIITKVAIHIPAPFNLNTEVGYGRKEKFEKLFWYR